MMFEDLQESQLFQENVGLSHLLMIILEFVGVLLKDKSEVKNVFQSFYAMVKT